MSLTTMEPPVREETVKETPVRTVRLNRYTVRLATREGQRKIVADLTLSGTCDPTGDTCTWGGCDAGGDSSSFTCSFFSCPGSSNRCEAC